MTETVLQGTDEKKLRDLALLVYVLQAVGFALWPTWVAGAVVNYVKIADVRNTWLETHFNWQLRTFWFWLAGMIVGFALLIVKIGWLINVGVTIWAIYRVVKGWLYLNDRKPMYDKLI
ncbi:MAG TPA: hypothetical protein VKC64_17565 [Burkholderiales bacterium]|nr:hypothetical protein [Burkholderiales bacterium]